MHPAPIRPRFTMDVKGDADALIERVRRAVEDPSRRLVCRVVDRHIDITMIPEDRRRWSPCLSLEIERGGADEEGVVRVRGLVGPHPSVWTMYALASIALIFLVVTMLIVAYAQHAIGERPTGVWWSLAFTGMLVGMYGVSQVGRRLAREQTGLLMSFMEETLIAPSGDADMSG